ncbi:unnamed protein product [Rhizoctonia solani]|uniref:F-box domain-containing protein n=1 Tax=Rhizoctonia solani TaxID=456999 RepID=A0A8H2XWN8_9AGAM|nr:unnamed protein product [Rhizoctonia solani]
MAGIRASAHHSTRENMARESETCKIPPRKIRRTVVEPTTRQLRKRRTSKLNMFLRIPMEIFAEIASHLFPIDLIALSRTSKLFRSLLMRRSSRHIWTDAMDNMPGLPPCPPDMSEPRYLSLLFTKNCTVRFIRFGLVHLRCILGLYRGAAERSKVGCMKSSGFDFVHHVAMFSPKGQWSKRGPPRIVYASKEQANEAQKKLEKLRRAKDQEQLDAWIGERQGANDARRMEASAIREFLRTSGWA